MEDDGLPLSPVVRPDATYSKRRRIEQAGAICIEHQPNSFEVLLVASRRNGSWSIPKGCIEKGETSGVAAAREAMEEGVCEPIVSSETIGSFVYSKEGSDLSYHINVHLLEVKEALAHFPEKQTRRGHWALLETAANEVSHPMLRDLLFCARGRMRRKSETIPT